MSFTRYPASASIHLIRKTRLAFQENALLPPSGIMRPFVEAALLVTAKVIRYALSELICRQQSSGFDNRSLAVDPLRFNPVEPRTFGGEPTGNDAYTLCAVLRLVQYRLIVLTKPGSDVLAHMPGGVIPGSLAAHRATPENQWSPD